MLVPGCVPVTFFWFFDLTFSTSNSTPSVWPERALSFGRTESDKKALLFFPISLFLVLPLGKGRRRGGGEDDKDPKIFLAPLSFLFSLSLSLSLSCLLEFVVGFGLGTDCLFCVTAFPQIFPRRRALESKKERKGRKKGKKETKKR